MSKINYKDYADIDISYLEHFPDYISMETQREATTILFVLSEEYSDEGIVQYAKTLIEAGYRDFAFSGVNADRWQRQFEYIDAITIMDEHDHSSIWGFADLSELLIAISMCNKKVQILCQDLERMGDCRRIIFTDRYGITEKADLIPYFQKMEKKMGMSWAKWELYQMEMLSWRTETDWWEDPIRKLDMEDLDFLEAFAKEIADYSNESILQLFEDEKKERVRVKDVVKYQDNLVIKCEAISDSNTVKYLHPGVGCIYRDYFRIREIIGDDGEQYSVITLLKPENPDMTGIDYIYLTRGDKEW